MRGPLGGRVAYQAADISEVFAIGWLQAGVLSFAYRLAHLALPRSIVVASLSLIFYLA